MMIFSCCICLDGFETNPVCRQLYCGHFHHDECIEKWLEKHPVTYLKGIFVLNYVQTCPDCRKPMTVKAIKEFLEDQTQEKKLDDEESIPINHPADVVTMQS